MKAFPTSESLQYKEHIVGGMDLRDYFAAAAITQINWMNAEISAKECYRIADAMIKARETK